MQTQLLEKVHDGHWHFLYGRVVEGLDCFQLPCIAVSDEVDGDSLPPEATGAAYTMDVVLAAGRQVVVDHQGNLKCRA